MHEPQPPASQIRHVLFDTDGVLQVVPGGWYAAMEPYLGDRAREFLHKTWADEKPTLAGQGDYMPMLAAALVEYGVTVPVDVVYRDVWHRIERIEESFAVVEALRRNGYGVHLGTNQEQHRGGHMRTALGYDSLFDTSCYSYDLGFAKPDPAFFAEAARRIGDVPEAILFVDDSLKNVEGARSAGVAAVHWDIERGHGALIEVLASHRVAARPTDGPTASESTTPSAAPSQMATTILFQWPWMTLKRQRTLRIPRPPVSSFGRPVLAPPGPGTPSSPSNAKGPPSRAQAIGMAQRGGPGVQGLLRPVLDGRSGTRPGHVSRRPRRHDRSPGPRDRR